MAAILSMGRWVKDVKTPKTDNQHGVNFVIIGGTAYGSGHEIAAVLLPGFAINW